MQMKQIVFYILVFLIGLSFSLFSSCSSFEPIVIKDQPQACNDMYSFMKWSEEKRTLFSKDNPSSGAAITFITTSYNECKEERKNVRTEKRRSECIKLIYGPQLLPKKENYKLYAEFLECLKIE